MSSPTGPSGPAAPDHGREHEEREDLVDHGRGLLLAGLGVGGFITVSFLITWLVIGLLQPSPPAREVDAFVDLEAQLLRSRAPLVTAELRALRQAVEAGWALEANTYALREDAAGFARIPVERAAELLLERGFPTRAQVAPGPRGEGRRGP